MNKTCLIESEYSFRNDSYLTLNVWGKPLVCYVIDNVLDSGIFDTIYFKTKNIKLISIVNNMYKNKVLLIDKKIDVKGIFVILNAYTPLLKKESIVKVVANLEKYGLVYCKKEIVKSTIKNKKIEYEKNDIIEDIFIGYNKSKTKSTFIRIFENESLIVENLEKFEAALALLKKENQKSIIENQIKKRIENKKNILANKRKKDEIVLIGHSQFDLWNINKLGEYSIRNCGISGINDFQYKELIIDKQLLNYDAKAFLFIGGTNDIVYGYSIKKIVEKGILPIINTLKEKSEAPIYLIECAQTNGRIDRNNELIRKLNNELYRKTRTLVHYICLDEMNNEFGDLKEEYTIDGLHFSKLGYKKFEEIIKKEIYE